MKKYSILFLIFFFVGYTFAQNNLKSIASKANNSVFKLIAFDAEGNEISKGCGFFVSETGKAVGNAAVFRNAASVKVYLNSGTELSIKNIKNYNALSNTVVFTAKLKEPIEFYEYSYARSLEGAEVLLVDNSGKKSKVELGNVKQLLNIEGFGELSELEQTIQASNIGCPVIDRSGKIVGLAVNNNSGLNYAVNFNEWSKTLLTEANYKVGSRKKAFKKLTPYNSIYTNILKKNFESALQAIKSEVKNDENSEHLRALYYLQAYCEKKLNKLKDAEDTYTSILELKLDDELAFLERAKLKIKLGNLKGAGLDLEESLQLNRTNQAEVKKAQGDLFVKLDNLRKADQLYAEAQRVGYDTYDIYRDRSKIATLNGEFEQAKTFIDKSIEANPYDAELYLIRGEINTQIGNIDEAKGDFEQSGKLGAPNLAGLKIIARSQLEMEDNEGAIKSLEKAYEFDEDDIDILYLRGQSFNRIKSYDEATIYLDKLLVLDPFNAKAYYERGKSNLALKNMNGCLQDFTKAIQLDPDYTGAYLDRGVAFGLIGEFQDAIKDFESVVALDPESSQGFYNLGLAMYQVKNRPAACRAWTQASELGYEEANERIDNFCTSQKFTSNQ